MSRLVENKPKIFPKIADTVNIDDEEERSVIEIKSLCMKCYKQGTTKLLLTEIPYFRDVVLSSFICESCGYNNTSIQSGGKIQEKGVKYTLNIKNKLDLNRQVVSSENYRFLIPHLDFEQPPVKQGEITTIESILVNVIENLELFQPQRKEMHPDTAEKVELFILKLRHLLEVEEPFDVVVEDPSGNSYVENPNAPLIDGQLTTKHYKRTKEQNDELGIDEEECVVKETRHNFQGEVEEQDIDLKNEVLIFDTNCPNCNAPCQTNMKIVDIPFFKQVVIMATVCDSCGARNNEVKSAAGIEDKGKRMQLKITTQEDLNRDVLKSDTCSVKIPDFDFELMDGTLGGKFSTIEGLIISIKDQLDSTNAFQLGDSSSTKNKMKEFTDKLDKLSKGEMMNITIILDDPAGNSYLENPFSPEEDPNLEVTHYDRTFEDNDILGINEMKTENY